MRFTGKTAIVTGSGQGIGEAYAKALAADGARVVIADLNADGAERVAGEITQSGGVATAVKVDVSDPASAQEMADAALAEFGRIDYLVNNAAIYGDMTLQPLMTVEPDYYRPVHGGQRQRRALVHTGVREGARRRRRGDRQPVVRGVLVAERLLLRSRRRRSMHSP